MCAHATSGLSWGTISTPSLSLASSASQHGKGRNLRTQILWYVSRFSVDSSCSHYVQITAFGSRPNTTLAASLGPGVLDASGFVKVKPTLELLDHPGIFAAGDIISWKEQKQAGKLLGHGPVITANIASFLAGTEQKKLYKGSTEMIIIPIGKVRRLLLIVRSGVLTVAFSTTAPGTLTSSGASRSETGSRA